MANPFRKLLDDAAAQGKKLVGQSVPNEVLTAAQKDVEDLMAELMKVSSKDEYVTVFNNSNKGTWEITFRHKSKRIVIVFDNAGKITAVN